MNRQSTVPTVKLTVVWSCLPKVKMSQNREDICRLCASHSELNQTSQELSQIILKHLSIAIKSDDSLSTKVCYKCEKKVSDFHNFSKECERIQSIFLDYKNVNLMHKQLVEIEISNNIQIKEELNFDERESCENFDEFIEAIEIDDREKAPVENLEKHKGVKKSKKIYALNYHCHICKLEFRNWSALSSHTKEEHNTNPQIKCLCNKILFNSRTVLHHEKKHNPDKCFKCNFCSKTFSAEKHLTFHGYTHLPKTNKPIVCSKCPKRYTNPRSLAAHESRSHEPRLERPRWPCGLCNSKLASKDGLASHMKIVHEKLKPYMCDLCGLSFPSKRSLAEHQYVHSSERGFACDRCDKKFKTRHTLRRHIDAHSDTAYRCPHCPMLLNSRDTLRNHLYVHDEVMNFTCSICEKGFRTRKYLKSHMKLHTGERPYTCIWCPRTFSAKSNYNLHKKKDHPAEFQAERKDSRFGPISDGNKDGPKKIIHTTIRTHLVPLKLNNLNETDK